MNRDNVTWSDLKFIKVTWCIKSIEVIYIMNDAFKLH